MLEGLTPQSIDQFDTSIDAVQEFVEKLCLVAGADGKLFPELLGTRQKTDQSFYYMWVMLEHVSKDYIKAHSASVFGNIRKKFSTISAAPNDLDALEFFATLPIFEE